MAQLSIQQSGVLGVVQKATVAASGGGDKFLNDGKTMLEVVIGATATVITITSVPCSHGRTKDIVTASLSNQTLFLGPFDPALFNDANGFVNISYSQVLNVTVGTLRNAKD